MSPPDDAAGAGPKPDPNAISDDHTAGDQTVNAMLGSHDSSTNDVVSERHDDWGYPDVPLPAGCPEGVSPNQWKLYPLARDRYFADDTAIGRDMGKIREKVERKLNPPKRRLTVAPSPDNAYAMQTLENLARELEAMPPHPCGRNETLNPNALRAYRVALAHGVDLNVVTARMTAAAQVCEMDDREISRTLRSARQAAERMGPAELPPEREPVRPAHQLDAADAQTEADPHQRPRLWRATDLKPAEQPRFLIPKRIPRAATTVFIGEEGIGKSLFVILLIALLTTRQAAPYLDLQAREPQHVVLVITEDNWSTDVRPRLEVAGADLDYIHVVCTDDDGSGAPVFPRDLDVLRSAEVNYSAVFVDAWVDTLPPGVQVKDPQQARQALHPWKELATTTDAAVVLVTHPNRLSSGSARDRYGVTSELRKKARMTLYATRDNDSGHLLVGPEKSNGTQIVAAGQYRIEAVPYFEPKPDHDGTVPRLVPDGTADQTMAQALASEFDAEHGTNPRDREEAVKWLEEYLLINAPSVRSNEVKRDAHKAGVSERTLQRARKDLGVVIGWEGSPPVTNWALPAKSAHQVESGGE